MISDLKAFDHIFLKSETEHIVKSWPGKKSKTWKTTNCYNTTGVDHNKTLRYESKYS